MTNLYESTIVKHSVSIKLVHSVYSINKIFRCNISSCFKTNVIFFCITSSVLFQEQSAPSVPLHVYLTEGNSQDWNPLNLNRSTNGLIDCSLQQ